MADFPGKMEIDINTKRLEWCITSLRMAFDDFGSAVSRLERAAARLEIVTEQLAKREECLDDGE